MGFGFDFGLDINKDAFKIALSQSYEFDANSNYNTDVGLRDYMSDLLGQFKYDTTSNKITNFILFITDS